MATVEMKIPKQDKIKK